MELGPRDIPWSIQYIVIGLISNAGGIALLLGGAPRAGFWAIALGGCMALAEVPVLLFPFLDRDRKSLEPESRP
jgi:hypothetical protein